MCCINIPYMLYLYIAVLGCIGGVAALAQWLEQWSYTHTDLRQVSSPWVPSSNHCAKSLGVVSNSNASPPQAEIYFLPIMTPSIWHAGRAEASERDAALRVALNNSRDNFSVPTGVYLCGNSLGAQPKRARVLLNDHLQRWALRGAQGHFENDDAWVSIENIPAERSLDLVGARYPFEIAYMNSLTVNIHIMLTALYRPKGERFKVLIDSTAFPSDMHALRTHLASRDIDHAKALVLVHPRSNEQILRDEDILDAIRNNSNYLALVFLPGVVYSTGQVLPMRAITAAAHAAGALIGLDLAHAVGNVELQLHDWGVDFAVWCSYKYLNGGPGAVGAAYLHARHADSSLPRLGGWWGVSLATRFATRDEYEPERGARGLQLSNVPVFSLLPVIAALDALAEAGGVRSVREQSIHLTAFLDRGITNMLSNRIIIVTPRGRERRGCQLSLQVMRGAAGNATMGIVNEKLAAHGIICDVREPDLLRVAANPLYNNYSDIVKFIEVLCDTLNELGMSTKS